MRRRQVFATAHESELAVFLKVTEEVICIGSSIVNTHLQGGQPLGMVGGVAEVLQELHEQCIGLHHTIPTTVAVEETTIGGCWSKDKTHAKRHATRSSTFLGRTSPCAVLSRKDLKSAWKSYTRVLVACMSRIQTDSGVSAKSAEARDAF